MVLSYSHLNKKRETPDGLGAEALAVRDEATATREKTKRIGHGSVIADYVFEWEVVRTRLLGEPPARDFVGRRARWAIKPSLK